MLAEGCCVPKNYAEEVECVNCNVNEFFGDTFYDNWDERAVDSIDEFRYINLKEITASEDEHNHDMLDDRLNFKLPEHRKMNDAAIDQMNLMLKFLRCICQMRSREAQSELASVVRDLVLKSLLHALERFTANTLTREIFMLFKPMLSRACMLKVRSCTLTPSYEISTMSMSKNPNKEWNVSHYRDRSIFKCSCFRMELLGIPCDRIVSSSSTS
ncbi:hypothetical protein Ahy_B07g087216 [Arachis hypogaea]|uniref:SWIM-type domain-containing protein n=1 Tax=Arachis hypogaea TaxID=3818 RepID=A0A444YBH5_ARAHY|nr:hypothetical protein Ahy_B07g087216 [Arachis hypogaea]